MSWSFDCYFKKDMKWDVLSKLHQELENFHIQ
jgi:hypothetical protein